MTESVAMLDPDVEQFGETMRCVLTAIQNYGRY